LLTYPTNLSALLNVFQQNSFALPKLKQIRTIGETLSPHIREQALAELSVEVIDIYSSQEVGVIAIQCPQSGLYHTMAESLIVEVLNEEGSACNIGETGRVVITDIQNFATPLVRYDIGDYAEVGEICPCGRGLPTLRRILGRQRNMVIHPNGKKYWPLVGFHYYRDIAPIRQYQLIQRSVEQIEVRLVVDVPMNANQQAKLTEVICHALGYPFHLHFVYFPDQIPSGPNGKFEEFTSEIS
jgi:phenylacetate-CoA ligase